MPSTGISICKRSDCHNNYPACIRGLPTEQSLQDKNDEKTACSVWQPADGSIHKAFGGIWQHGTYS